MFTAYLFNLQLQKNLIRFSFFSIGLVKGLKLLRNLKTLLLFFSILYLVDFCCQHFKSHNSVPFGTFLFIKESPSFYINVFLRKIAFYTKEFFPRKKTVDKRKRSFKENKLASCGMVRQYLLVALSLNTLLRHRGPKICCFVVCPAAQKVVFSEYDIYIYRFFSHKILSLIRVGTNILLSSIIDKKSELLTILEILGQINLKSIF